MRQLAPPHLTNDAGDPRRIGVELELGGLDLADIAGIVAEVFGGEVERRTDYNYAVFCPAGEFKVEADLELLRRIGEDRAAGLEDGDLLATVANRIGAAFGELVAPSEIVGPPMLLDSLERFDELVARLRDRGAVGTRSGLLATYGAQLNPDAPSLEADSIACHIRAFALVYEWLAAEIDVDLSRRVTAFVDPYPEAYTRLLAGGYSPGLAALIDDYLAANPTRNRALDMLPLFAHLDEPRVRAAIADPQIKSRPTYHYRLPDSRVRMPGWNITREWQRWLVVEHVAADPELAGRIAGAYLAHVDAPVLEAVTALSWAETCGELLIAAGLVGR